MAKPKTAPEPKEFTEEITVYVTPDMKAQIAQISNDKGVSISVCGRWAFEHWLTTQRRG